MRRPRASCILPALLLLATALVHSPGLGGEFVFDDHRFVPENLAIRDLGNTPRFFTDVSTMTTVHGASGWNDIYRPLRTLSFALDWALFGSKPLPYRLENLAWHLLAVALAWLLARRLLGHPWAATFAAGVFALHPAQVESVSWISSRGDLMAGVLLLGASLLVLRDGPGRRRTIAAVVLYSLALFGKESAIAFLALVPVYDVLFREDRRPRWRLVGVLAAVTAVFLAIRFGLTVSQGRFEAATLAIAGSGIAIVVGTLLAPVGLAPYTGDILGGARLATAAGGALLLIAVAVAAIVLRRGRRWPVLAFAILWFAICLAPVSGLVPLKSVAETRFLYLPLLGFGLLLAALARPLGRRALAPASLLLLCLAALTARESRFWRTDLGLWEEAVARQERALGRAGGTALGNLGLARIDEGRTMEAIQAFDRAIENRGDGQDWCNLAYAYSILGNVPQTLDAIERVLAIAPDDASLRGRIGEILLRTGRSLDAVPHLEFAVEREPTAPVLRRNLARALMESGCMPEALVEAEACVDLAPNGPIAWLTYGKALHASRRLDEALRAYETARDLDPTSAQPHLFLGRARLDRGEPEAALAELAAAAAIEPANPAIRAETLAAETVLGRKPRDVLVRELRQVVAELRLTLEPSSVIAVLHRPAVRRLRDPGLDTEFVQALLDVGNLGYASVVLNELARARPSDPELRGQLGLVELMLGRPDAALPHLRLAASGLPDSFEYRIGLAEALRDVGRREDATRVAAQAMGLARSPEERNRARLLMAGSRR